MSKENRLGVLDGLRGAMALWVLIGHACGATGMNYIPIIRSPHYAVDGFMILSGFLMAYHYILRSEKEPWTLPSTWKTFYVRRFFRISPLYYLLLIPAYAFGGSFMSWRTAVHTLARSDTRVPDNPPYGFEHVTLHLTYLFGLFPKYHSSLVLPDWSLSLEMQFYLVFPFLMLFVLRFGWIPFSLVCTAVWLFARSHFLGIVDQFIQPSALPLSLLWFAIGMVWASAHLQSDKSSRWKILIPCGLSLLSKDPHDITLVFVFAWIIFAPHRFPIGNIVSHLRRTLSGRVAIVFGDASYSVYLTHLLILTPVSYLLYTKFKMNPAERFIIAFTITAGVSYGVAKPFEIVENAGIALGKRLTRKGPAGSGAGEIGKRLPAPSHAAL